VVAAIVGAAGAVVAAWLVPPLVYRPAEQAEARAALQAGLLTMVAALLAVVGGLVALVETRRANENTHVRELYAAAINHLGSDTVDVRLGGLYALERIAVDSPADQRTVVEVLSAFVRERSQRAHTGLPFPPVRPATDVQAALTILGRLPDRPGLPRADLTGAILAGARLGGANLAGARLVDVDLTDARLAGAVLTGARLARSDLTRARLARADLSGARLGGTILVDAWMEQTNLTGALLRGADLTGAHGLTQEQLEQARGDEHTTLPASLTRPASWSTPPPA